MCRPTHARSAGSGRTHICGREYGIRTGGYTEEINGVGFGQSVIRTVGGPDIGIRGVEVGGRAVVAGCNYGEAGIVGSGVAFAPDAGSGILIEGGGAGAYGMPIVYRDFACRFYPERI